MLLINFALLTIKFFRNAELISCSPTWVIFLPLCIESNYSYGH